MIRITSWISASLVILASLIVAEPAMAFNRQAPNCGGARWIDQCDPRDWQCTENMLMPVRWYINSTGYSSMTSAQVKTIFDNAWDAWTSPCCSDWEVAYQNTTNANAFDGNNGIHVLSFHESSWPSTAGSVNSTIGVTPSIIRSDCIIVASDIGFNGVGFTFVDGAPPQFSNQADLQSIAVHEMGHFLGLDHSEVFGSSLWASYSGSVGERSLHRDDENAVCTIYPGSCGCNNNSDCDADEQCVGGTCQFVPCNTSSNPCETPLVCNTGTGQCEPPPCTADSDCTPGYVCNTSNGDCEPDGSCAICRSCTDNNDCGAGYFCASTGSESFCIANCDNAYRCAGDAQCFGVTYADGNTYPTCLNPDFGRTGAICPDTYTCTDRCAGVTCSGGQLCDPASGQCYTPSCNGLGGTCTCDSQGCQVGPTCDRNDIDTCLTTDDGASYFCSCTCTSDIDCGPGNTCVQTSGGGACVPGSTTNPCDGVTCPAGQTCDPNTGLCAGGTPECPGLGGSCFCDASGCTASNECTSNNDWCITGQDGQNGTCSCSCTTDADCGAGNSCVLNGGDGYCAIGGGNTNLCDGVTCPTGRTCNPATGACEAPAPCEGITCPIGQLCNPNTGRCEGGSTGVCDGVVCPSGTTCDSSTGNCVPNAADTGNGGEDTSTGQDTGAPGTDTGTAGTDTGNINAGSGNEDCSCATVRASSSSGSHPLLPAGLFMAGFAALALRRRRR